MEHWKTKEETCKEDSLHIFECVCECGKKLDIESFLRSDRRQQRQDTAQECYLEVLAVGCGESEFSEAIKSKFNLK